MIKKLSFLLIVVAGGAIGIAQTPHHDKSVHHAAIHAEHWLTHHTSAPHKRHRRYPKRGRKDKSVHHAAMHAESWTTKHINPPGHK